MGGSFLKTWILSLIQRTSSSVLSVHNIRLPQIIVAPIDFFSDWAFNVSGSTGIDGFRGLGQYKYQSNPFIPLIPVLFAGSTGIGGFRGLGQSNSR
jgi:hypothetical protein